MAKLRILLLAAGLIVLVFALIVIFTGTEKEIRPEEISQQETIIEEIGEETIKEEVIQEEIITEEELKEHQESNWQWLARQKPIYQLGLAEINSILKELPQQFPDKKERLKALTLWRLATPYQPGPLGEEKGPDKDPIFRTEVTDCTAFILTTAALLHS